MTEQAITIPPENKPGKRMGRPPKLTDAKTQELVKYLEGGNYLETAASLAGIDVSAVKVWIKQGRRIQEGQAIIKTGQRRYLDFVAAVQKAMAKSEVDDLELIGKAGMKGSWQANAWRLERRMPGKWGQRQAHQHQVQIDVVYRDQVMDQPIEIEADRTDDDQ